MKCPHAEVLVEDGGPRNPWRGYTFCVECGETIGTKWRRMIDDVCERRWSYRPNRTKPIAIEARRAETHSGSVHESAGRNGIGEKRVFP